MLIALEGIDGSGKATQANRLADRLRDAGYRVDLITFPQYGENAFAELIAGYLNGELGAIRDVQPRLAALMFAGDRLTARDRLQAAADDPDAILVCDRYVASKLAHQGSRLESGELADFVDWVERIEHDIYQLPRADISGLLQLPPSRAAEMVARKAPRDYTDRPADLHESDADYLLGCDRVYRWLARREPDRWLNVDPVGQDEALRAPDAVADELARRLRDRLGLRI